MRFVILVAVVCGLVIGVGAVQADTCTFDVPSGDWDVLENWDCVVGGEQVPTAADRAVIQSGKICNIDSPAVADSLEVESTATLNILAGHKLTLDGDNDDSTIDGTLTITASGEDVGELAFVDNTQTISGDFFGKIVGLDEAAKITVALGITLTNRTTIEGALQITGTGDFKNGGTVHANTSGTLEITTGLLDDEPAGFWQVSTSSSVVLHLAAQNTFLLDGSFTILTGILTADAPGFMTFGDLTMKGGAIEMPQGAIAVFKYSP